MIPKPFVITPREEDNDESYTVVATGTDAESRDFFLIVNADGEMKWVNEDEIREEYLFVRFIDTDADAPPAGPSV